MCDFASRFARQISDFRMKTEGDEGPRVVLKYYPFLFKAQLWSPECLYNYRVYSYITISSKLYGVRNSSYTYTMRALYKVLGFSMFRIPWRWNSSYVSGREFCFETSLVNWPRLVPLSHGITKTSLPPTHHAHVRPKALVQMLKMHHEPQPSVTTACVPCLPVYRGQLSQVQRNKVSRANQVTSCSLPGS